ncbi:uncharacterized protein LOC144719121 isoform X4 [Lampetra planeri]
MYQSFFYSSRHPHPVDYYTNSVPFQMHRQDNDVDYMGGPVDLRPRHGDLQATPIGPIKPWAELKLSTRIILCLSLLALVGMLILTIVSMVMHVDGEKDKSEVTFSIVQCIGMVFSIYYMCRGILQENLQEMFVFSLSVAMLLARSIANFAVMPQRNGFLIARFCSVLLVSLFLITWAIVVLCRSGSMTFRVSGLLEEVQKQYFIFNMCTSLLTFDLQLQWMLSVLVLSSGIYTIDLVEKILLSLGIVWAFLKVIAGFVSILREIPWLLLTFVVMNVPELCYVGYLIYKLTLLWKSEVSFPLLIATVVCSAASILLKCALLWYLRRAHANFGRGLRDRIWNRARGDDTASLSAESHISSS